MNRKMIGFFLCLAVSTGIVSGQTRTTELGAPLAEGLTKTGVLAQYLVDRVVSLRKAKGLPPLDLRVAEVPGKETAARVLVPFLKGDSGLEVVEAALAHWEDRGILDDQTLEGQEVTCRIQFTPTGGNAVFQASRLTDVESEFPELPASLAWGQRVSVLAGARYAGPWPSGGTAYSLPSMDSYPMDQERPQRVIALTKKGTDILGALLSRHSKGAFQGLYDQMIKSRGTPEKREAGLVEGDTEPAVIFTWSGGKVKLYQGETFTWLLLTE